MGSSSNLHGCGYPVPQVNIHEYPQRDPHPWLCFTGVPQRQLRSALFLPSHAKHHTCGRAPSGMDWLFNWFIVRRNDSWTSWLKPNPSTDPKSTSQARQSWTFVWVFPALTPASVLPTGRTQAVQVSCKTRDPRCSQGRPGTIQKRNEKQKSLQNLSSVRFPEKQGLCNQPCHYPGPLSFFESHANVGSANPRVPSSRT